MVYRIDFDKAPDAEAVVAELAATAAAAGAHMVPAFEDRPGRYRIEPWDITVDMDWQVHLSIPTRPDADPASAVQRLYLLARDLDSLGLRGVDRELGTPISSITDLDIPTAEFAAQIEKAKSPVPDAVPPVNTDRVPWPTNWDSYTPFERIGGKTPGSELSEAEALARFEQITSSIDQRITELGKLTRAHGFNLSTQPEDVKQLTDWLIASIEDDGYGQLRPYWDSVLYDVAMFVGDAAIKRIPYLYWTIPTKGTRRSTPHFRETVIGGFKNTPSSTTEDVFRDIAGMSAVAYVGAREVFINKRLQLLTKKDEPLPKFVPSPELQDALSRTDDED
ncbi:MULTISPECIES: hypothetical protein [unclassified Mycobacterium]|uniref:hypothetical protein n=1 Tax=unclassified Mycobacterium TaxID=2642494 RepID=UPI000899E9C1|nr:MULTISPECIES: hypothetical protein [unclassified Mycobacterium]SEB18039.1 hypothetical protein SAMN04488580_109172 [Mycobacterium sp. 283mftsu]